MHHSSDVCVGVELKNESEQAADPLIMGSVAVSTKDNSIVKGIYLIGKYFRCRKFQLLA